MELTSPFLLSISTKAAEITGNVANVAKPLSGATRHAMTVDTRGVICATSIQSNACSGLFLSFEFWLFLSLGWMGMVDRCAFILLHDGLHGM